MSQSAFENWCVFITRISLLVALNITCKSLEEGGYGNFNFMSFYLTSARHMY